MSEIEKAILESIHARQYEERRRAERRVVDNVSHRLLNELVEFMKAKGYEADMKEILNKHK